MQNLSFQLFIKHFWILFSNSINNLNSNQSMKVFFVTCILYLLVCIFEHILKTSKPVNNIELWKQWDVLNKQSKKNQSIQILLLWIFIEFVSILLEILYSSLNPFQLQILLKYLFQAKYRKKSFIGVVMNYFRVCHYVSKVLQGRMGKVFSKLSPKSFNSNFNLSNSWKSSYYNISFLVR